MNKFKVAYLHHQSMLNLEDEAGKEAGNDAAGNDAGNDAGNMACNMADNKAGNKAGDEAAIEASKETCNVAGNEAGNVAGNRADEEEINIKEIYRKLLFIFHPDKSISPNEQIVGEIKKAWDDKYEPTILYYFYKNK